MDFVNDIHWGTPISLTNHLGGRGYGETIQLGGGSADLVGSCTGAQGQLYWVFVIEGVKDRRLDYAHTKGCWLLILDWWDYKVTALIQGLPLLSTEVVGVIHHHA